MSLVFIILGFALIGQGIFLLSAVNEINVYKYFKRFSHLDTDTALTKGKSPAFWCLSAECLWFCQVFLAWDRKCFINKNTGRYSKRYFPAFLLMVICYKG